MEKYLSIPVIDAHGTNSQDQLVSISGLRIVSQATTTTVLLKYLDGKTATLTWPNAYASPLLLESVESAIVDALSSGWTNIAHEYDPKGSVPGATSSDPITNPLASIVVA
tara:strand:- start:13316 stop:13645 length:330 start_codon:yes stop_codon:yes gene_type:complete